MKSEELTEARVQIDRTYAELNINAFLAALDRFQAVVDRSLATK